MIRYECVNKNTIIEFYIMTTKEYMESLKIKNLDINKAKEKLYKMLAMETGE